MSPDKVQTVRIEAQISPEALALVKRAAKLQGKSLSDFVVSAAQEAAHRAIEETHLIHLLAEDQGRFVDLLLDPTPLTPTMERAKEAHARLFGKSTP